MNGAPTHLDVMGSLLAVAGWVAYVWICIALYVKRLHDIDKSGWNLLWTLLPLFGSLLLLYWTGFKKGTTGANRFGIDPLGGENAAVMQVSAVPVKTSALKIVGIITLVLTDFAVMILIAMTIIKLSAANKTAEAYIRSNSEISAQIGGVTGFGALPMGEVHINNGSGKALLNITVHGTYGDAETVVTLSKAPDKDWQVDNFKSKKIEENPEGY